MIKVLKDKLVTIFNAEVLLYISIFFVILKNIFVVNTTYLTYIYMSYCILYFIVYVLLNFKNISINNYIIGLLFILTFIISSIINNKINRENIAILIDVFINFFVYLHIFDNLENDRIEDLLKKMFRFFVVFSFVWALIGVFFVITGASISFFGNTYGLISKFRLQLVRPSVNPTGFAALAFIGCNLFFLLKKETFNKLFLIINIGLQLFIIFFTQSMGTMLAMFVSIFVFTAYYINKKHSAFKLVVFSLIGIFVILILGAIIVSSLGIKSRVLVDTENLLSNKDSFISFIVRYDIIVYGMLVLLNNNLLFGSSFGGLKSDWANNYNRVISQHQFSESFIRESEIVGTAATHNAFLTIVFSNGIIGSIVLLVFIIFIIYNIIIFYKNICIISDDLHISYLIVIFFIVSSIVIALTGECIIISIVDYTNLFFFISLSALINFNKNLGLIRK